MSNSGVELFLNSIPGYVVLPVNAPYNFGADEFTDQTNFENSQEYPGDIVKDHYSITPPATRDVKVNVPFKKETTVRILNRDSNKYEQVKGRHWGDGVVLLDQDDRIIAPLLDLIFESE